MTFFLMILPGLIGLALLVGGAELLVRGASALAAKAGVPSLVIGLTVVAFGTSAPELAVSTGAALRGQASIALGNVIGSNIFNVLVILGLAALILPLSVQNRLVRLDVPLMIGVSVLAWIIAANGSIGRLEGAVLVVLLLAWTTALVIAGRRETASTPVETPAEPAGVPKGTPLWLSLVFVAAGLGLLVLGSNWLVSSAVGVARAFGLSEFVIGVTLVAAGTSVPELATSIVAAARGERDLAVGNVVGSNIFNLLGVLGFSAFIAGDGVAVAGSVLALDFPVMLLVALACWPAFLTGLRVSRIEGALFLSAWALYTALLLAPAASTVAGADSLLVSAGIAFVGLWVIGAALLAAAGRRRRSESA